MAKSFQDELFATLAGFGYLLKMYDSKGKGPLSDPNLAAYIQAVDKTNKDDNLMLHLPADASAEEYPKLVIYKSETVNPKFDKLLATVKQVALKSGYTVTYRVFGQSITPKDLAYAPKAEKEAEQAKLEESMPSGVIKQKQKLSFMNDKELCEYLKGKTEEQVEKLQRSHALKNNRYLDVWKKVTVPVKESKYETYGSTRSSYHENPKEGKSRVIIRHSKVVDESKSGARSRSVKTLMVETKDGERRIIPSKSLRGARALANYVNHGGNIYDESANRIVKLSDDVKSIRNLKKKFPMLEGDADNSKIHEAITEITGGLTDLLERLNSNKISDYLPILEVSETNMVFSENFYKVKLGEEFHDSVGCLARGSIIHSRTRKF